MDAAAKLFYQQGIGNVGLKEIAKVADVAYMSLYNNFGSKDALVVATLKERIQEHRGWLDSALAKAKAPKAALLAVFEGLEARLIRNEARGCALINATIELADREHPAQVLARSYKEEVRERLEGLASAAKLRDPVGLSHQLMLLLDGGNVTALVRGDPSVARYAHAAAKALIEAASV